MKRISKVNGCLTPSRFIPVDREELTALEYMAKLQQATNEIIDVMDDVVEKSEASQRDKLDRSEYKNDIEKIRKIDSRGDFTGSWFGIKSPSYANETIANVVESHEQRLGKIYDVRYFGVVGDGVTDDTLALQSALDYSRDTGCELTMSGEFLVSDTLNIYSNTTLRGVGMAKINMGGIEWEKPLFHMLGAVRETKQVVKDVGAKDNIIETLKADLKTGDFFILNSQRSCFGKDSGESFRLGTSTETTEDSYFGEFLNVLENIHSGECEHSLININSSTIYKCYKSNKIGEVDSNAKNSSYIEVCNFVENVVIDGIEIYNGETQSNALIKCEYMINSEIRNIRYSCIGNGHFISLIKCYNVHVDSCHVEYVSNKSTSHYSQNGYKILSSQLCGFNNCTSINGEQPFDLTYVGLEMPTTNCYISNCKIVNSRQTGITTHPGVYACSFTDNIISSQGDGMGIRGQGHNINGNTLMYVGSVGGDYGIGLIEGFANNINVVGNSIDGYDMGIRIHESVSSRDLSYNTLLRNNIVGNKISRMRIGVYIDRVTNSTTKSVDGCIKIANNMFTDFYTIQDSNASYVLYVGGSDVTDLKNIEFIDNVVNLKSSANISPVNLIRFDSNGNLRVIGNLFMSMIDDCRIFYNSGATRNLNVEMDDNKFVALGKYKVIHGDIGKTNINSLSVNTTSKRPKVPIKSAVPYFDTTLNKPIWYNGTNWVDSTGQTV